MSASATRYGFPILKRYTLGIGQADWHWVFGGRSTVCRCSVEKGVSVKALRVLSAAAWLLATLGPLAAEELSSGLPPSSSSPPPGKDIGDPAYSEPYRSAEARYSEALAKSGATAAQTAALHRGRALLYRSVERHEAALADIEAALRETPEDASLLYLRGALRLETGQAVAAREDFSRALAADPDLADARLARGLSFLFEGDATSAISDFDAAIESDRDAAEALSLRGHARAALRQHDRALEDFNAALRRDPMLVSAYAGRAFSLSGRGEHERAEGDYSLALAIDPDFAEGYRGRAEARRRLGRREAAVEDYDRALMLDPTLSAALVGRGLVKRRLGRFDQAAADFGAAIALAPVTVDAYRARAVTRFYMAQYLSAARDYRRALGLQAASAYSVIWLFLSQERAGLEGYKALTRNAGRLKLKPGHWPFPVLAFFQGQMTPERLVEATRHENRRRERERQCEAFFYLGQHYLLEDDPAQAKRYFRKAIETGITGFIEYQGAKVELRRL